MPRSIACALVFACVSIATAVAQTPDWVGRWYAGDASVCRKKTGETEGLLVYTPREFTGYESKCRIMKTAPQGRATALTLRCRAEGETYDESETVEVVQGRLRRTVLVERKRTTFSYGRCGEQGG